MSIDLTGTPEATVDSDRWPSVARVPSGPVSAAVGAIADRLFRRAAARLPIRVVYPDGTVVGAADPTLPTMFVHRPEAMVRRVGRYGLIGFGESYMAGDWSSTDLVGLLTEFAKRLTELIPPVLQRFRPLAVVRQPRSHHNSREQARRNIAEHYDLSNDLFAEFLDETMTYSSALFGSLPAGQSCLAERPTDARSTDFSTPRASGQAAECSKSARAGANCASGRRREAHRSVRSRCPPSSSDWPVSGWPRRDCPTASRSTCAITATSTAVTTPCCRWK